MVRARDTTAAESLELLLDELDAAGVTLAFAELKDPVKVRLRHYGTMRHIGEGRCFPTIGTAVDGYVAASGASWVDWEDADHGAAVREERRPAG